MSDELKREIAKNTVKRGAQILFQFFLFALILFISAGRLHWIWAWSYLGACMAIVLINALVLPRGLIVERGRSKKENVKQWDKVITSLSIVPTLGTLAVAGLDERFGWTSHFNLGFHILGIVLFIFGNALFSWAMASNYFFSTEVRIQTDRSHKVATGGPYRYVRHPGYVGFIVWNLVTPLFLGSFWALIPAALTAGLFVMRTAFEDRTLQKELEGYKEYSQNVRFRLFPGIW